MDVEVAPALAAWTAVGHDAAARHGAQSLAIARQIGRPRLEVARPLGGRIDRGAPCYGEDNEYVYGELLGMTKREIADLAAEGVF